MNAPAALQARSGKVPKEKPRLSAEASLYRSPANLSAQGNGKARLNHGGKMASRSNQLALPKEQRV